MNDLKIFTNEQFGDVRVVVKEDKPWFVLADVCKVLEISNPSDVKNRLEEDVVSIEPLQTAGGKQKVTVINEDGLYDVILDSRKPEAKKFRKWVTSEVLPMIRKTGMYVTDNVWEQIHHDPAKFGQLLLDYAAAKNELAEQSKKVAILTHVNKTYVATEIGKELGYSSAKAFNKELEKRKIQYYVNGTWVLRSDYSTCGYVHIKQEILDTGKVVYHRKWTQLGREFLLQLFQNESKEGM